MITGTTYGVNSIRFVEEQETKLMSQFIVLFHFFYAQHISDINTSIIRSLRLFYCITTLVVCSCFDVCWSFSVAGLGWYLCCRLKPVNGYHPNQPH